MHNIRTTIKTRGHLASLTETKSEPAVTAAAAAAAAAVTGLADHNSRSSNKNDKIPEIIIRPSIVVCKFLVLHLQVNSDEKGRGETKEKRKNVLERRKTG